MKNMKLNEVRKVIRLTDPLSPEKTAYNLIQDIKRPSPKFSYAITRRNAEAIFKGDMTENQITLSCSNGSKQSQKCNKEASLKLLEAAPLLRKDPVMCRNDIKPVIFKFKQNHAIMIKPQFFYTDNGKVFIVWIQFCKTDHYTLFHLNLISTLMKKEYGENFDHPEIIIIDLSAPNKSSTRGIRIFRSSDHEPLSDRHIESFFDVYIQGVEIAENNGYQVTSPYEENDLRDDDQGNLI